LQVQLKGNENIKSNLSLLKVYITLMSNKCHTPESPVLWAFLKLKMPKKADFCYDPCRGSDYLFIAVSKGMQPP